MSKTHRGRSPNLFLGTVSNRYAKRCNDRQNKAIQQHQLPLVSDGNY